MKIQPQPESTWTDPTTRCPHPERWHSTDDDSTELEVTELVQAFVRALQPSLVIETGSAWGQTSQAIGQALQENGHGQLVTFEPDPERADYTRNRVKGLPVEVRQCSSLDPTNGLPALTNEGAEIQFAWLDSLFELRFTELHHIRPALTPGAIVGMHDTAPHHPLHAQLDHKTEATRLDLPTPRGVTFIQPRRPH